MATVASEFMYHLVVNNIAPIMASSLTGIYTSYFSGGNRPTPTLVRSDTDDERELDQLQMDRMLKWMGLIFEDSFEMIETHQCGPGKTCPHSIPCPTATITPQIDDTHKAYKKELYSIYMTIGSDYKQYQHWKQYNSNIWVFSSYRNKNTKAIAKKILADVRLFHEGLKMFSMFEKL
jgi:hypothetical protein